MNMVLFPPQCSTFRPKHPDSIPALEEAVTRATKATGGATGTNRHDQYWRRRREMKVSTEEEEVIFYYRLFLYSVLSFSLSCL